MYVIKDLEQEVTEFLRGNWDFRAAPPEQKREQFKKALPEVYDKLLRRARAPSFYSYSEGRKLAWLLYLIGEEEQANDLFVQLLAAKGVEVKPLPPNLTYADLGIEKLASLPWPSDEDRKRTGSWYIWVHNGWAIRRGVHTLMLGRTKVEGDGVFWDAETLGNTEEAGVPLPLTSESFYPEDWVDEAGRKGLWWYASQAVFVKGLGAVRIQLNVEAVRRLLYKLPRRGTVIVVLWPHLGVVVGGNDEIIRVVADNFYPPEKEPNFLVAGNAQAAKRLCETFDIVVYYNNEKGTWPIFYGVEPGGSLHVWVTGIQRSQAVLDRAKLVAKTEVSLYIDVEKLDPQKSKFHGLATAWAQQLDTWPSGFSGDEAWKKAARLFLRHHFGDTPNFGKFDLVELAKAEWPITWSEGQDYRGNQIAEERILVIKDGKAARTDGHCFILQKAVPADAPEGYFILPKRPDSRTDLSELADGEYQVSASLRRAGPSEVLANIKRAALGERLWAGSLKQLKGFLKQYRKKRYTWLMFFDGGAIVYYNNDKDESHVERVYRFGPGQILPGAFELVSFYRIGRLMRWNGTAELWRGNGELFWHFENEKFDAVFMGNSLRWQIFGNINGFPARVPEDVEELFGG